MNHSAAVQLGFARTAVLSSVAAACLIGPVVYGATEAFSTPPQSIPEPLRFEAASIKPNNGESPLNGGRCTGIDSNFAGAVLPTAPPPLGTCRYLRITVSRLMNVAYVGEQTDKMVSGGPGWTSTLEFDLVAKAEDPAHSTTDQLRKMLQTLLAERFKVQLHRETRNVKGYALVRARNAGSLHDPLAYERPFVGVARPDGKVPAPDLVNLTSLISRILKVPVIDRTGITAQHDFSLAFDEGSRRFVDPLNDPDPSGTSIFAAVEKQLGLHLQPQTVPVEVIVIDSAQLPTNDEDVVLRAFRGVISPAQPQQEKWSRTASVQPMQTAPPATAGTTLSFEIASIKPNKSGITPSAMGIGPATGPTGCHGTDRGPQTIPLGRCMFTNVTAGFLLSTISIISGKEYHFSGLPDGVTTEGFDIEAKAEHPVTTDELAVMLESLLTERFKCSFHTETRQVSGFALTVASKGPRLVKSDNQDPQTAREANTSVSVVDALTQLQVTPARAMTLARPLRVAGPKASLAKLASVLSNYWSAPIVDATKLKGYYTFQLRWQPEGNSTAAIDRTDPILPTALQEQLGLKLEPAKVPIEYLVVDHIEKPILN